MLCNEMDGRSYTNPATAYRRAKLSSLEHGPEHSGPRSFLIHRHQTSHTDPEHSGYRSFLLHRHQTSYTIPHHTTKHQTATHTPTPHITRQDTTSDDIQKNFELSHIYRTSIDRLSNIDRTPIEHLSANYRTTSRVSQTIGRERIYRLVGRGLRSKSYCTSIEHLSIVYRTSIEHRSNIYRTTIGQHLVSRNQ